MSKSTGMLLFFAIVFTFLYIRHFDREQRTLDWQMEIEQRELDRQLEREKIELERQRIEFESIEQEKDRQVEREKMGMEKVQTKDDDDRTSGAINEAPRS